MESSAVPPALRERLGGDGTAGLLELLETTRRMWSAEVTSACLERFERRLVEKVAGLRVEMADGHAKLRTEIASLRREIVGEMAQMEGRLRTDIASLRGEMTQMDGRLRIEIAQTGGTLRGDLVREMQIGFATVRQEMANNRVEFLRWSFLFWVGQFFAVAGLVGILMRTAPAR